MPYDDLRTWLACVEQQGEVLHVSGAETELEMSSIAEIMARESKDPKPSILFDSIPGYPACYKTLFGTLTSIRKIALTLGLSQDISDRLVLLRQWMDKSKNLRLIPPKLVSSGPVFDN